MLPGGKPHEPSTRANERGNCRGTLGRKASVRHPGRRRLPDGVSQGVAAQAANGSDLGPYVIYAPTEPIVVGEIGGGFTSEGTVEIGYAVVRSHWGRGIATAAVRELVRRIAERPDVRRIVAHTPLDRPESARVVEKAGFTFAREMEDTHEGAVVRVKEWELQFER